MPLFHLKYGYLITPSIGGGVRGWWKREKVLSGDDLASKMEKFFLFFSTQSAYLESYNYVHTTLPLYVLTESERKSSLVRMRRKSPSLLIKDVLSTCCMEMRKQRKEEEASPPISSYSLASASSGKTIFGDFRGRDFYFFIWVEFGSYFFPAEIGLQ